MLREIYNRTLRSLKKRFAGHQTMQDLLDSKDITMSKTRDYTSEDDGRLDDPGSEFTIKPWGPPGTVTVWSYRFKFDNTARKRRFLNAITDAPDQEWDKYARWLNDISNLNGEITVETHFRVPPEKVGEVRYKFEYFATRELVLKDEK